MNKSYKKGTYWKITVIIPTYHRVVDLSELFDSILRQTINPVEIIVVDDTPDDSIKNVCEIYELEFEKSNTCLKYIRNPRQRGMTIARNVGVKNASGDIILFLDSDTVLYQKYIEKILEVYNDNANTLGVQGWIINSPKYNKIKHFLIQFFFKTFCLHHYSKNSCKFFEYPILLSNIINCTWLSGSNMSFKNDVFREFSFDESFNKYFLGEDKLFSHFIFQKYPNTLFITPYAKLIHNVSKEDRVEDKVYNDHIDRCRKYFLMQLFGFKGLIIYHWQMIGISIIRICKRFL